MTYHVFFGPLTHKKNKIKLGSRSRILLGRENRYQEDNHAVVCMENNMTLGWVFYPFKKKSS